MGLLTLEESVKKYIGQIQPLPAEKVPITKCLRRVLADDVHSDVNMPPFDKSAMDGYACRLDDLKQPLEIIETIPAGHFPKKEIGPGQCAKIMTGAPVPKGADCVIMIEHTQISEDGRVVFTKENTKSNICLLGEDVSKGDLIFSKGTLISSRIIPMLASTGFAEVPVHIQPRVGIIATGSELVEPSEKINPASIRNSNSYQLIGMLQEMNISPYYYGIVKDDEESISSILKKAFAENHITILTGGVSVGDFDLVPKIIKNLGMEVFFHKLAIQPGKPVLMAGIDNKYCFALSGNPVSSFFQFDLLCKPAIFNLMGHTYQPDEKEFTLAKNVKRKKGERLGLFPVNKIDSSLVEPAEFHGSAHINALGNAYGYVTLQQGCLELKKGEKVHVRSL